MLGLNPKRFILERLAWLHFRVVLACQLSPSHDSEAVFWSSVNVAVLLARRNTCPVFRSRHQPASGTATETSRASQLWTSYCCSLLSNVEYENRQETLRVAATSLSVAAWRPLVLRVVKCHPFEAASSRSNLRALLLSRTVTAGAAGFFSTRRRSFGDVHVVMHPGFTPRAHSAVCSRVCL